MSDIDPTTPLWSPYAADVVRRLHLTLPVADRVSSRETFLTAPEEELPEPLPDDTTQDDATTARDADEEPAPAWVHGDDWGGLKPSGPRRLSALQLQLTLRLAATIENQATPLRWLERGTTTMIVGMTQADIRMLKTLLWLGFLPPGCQIVTKPGRHSAKASDVVLLRPDADGGEMNRSVLRSFHDQIAEALASPLPVLILCPDEAALPQSLKPYLPQPLHLAPVDRGIMLQQLRLSYPRKPADVGALLAALPADGALATLPVLGLHVAFRAPDAMTAAKRLADFEPVLVAVDSGPRLEDIAGNSEALTAARQLLSDLNLWQSGELPWSDLCRSMLLYGGPGTGKSHLARAMGNSADVSFVQASFATWQEGAPRGHAGGNAGELRRCSEEATVHPLHRRDRCGGFEGRQ